MSLEILIHTFLLLLFFALCLVAIELRDLLYAVILLGGASVTLAVIFYMLQAPDIATTQAAVGAGIATILFVVTVSKTKREE